MRRLVVAIVICLLFGAIVTVAVAWAFQWRALTRQPSVAVRPGLGHEVFLSMDDSPDSSAMGFPAAEHTGWPMRCLRRTLTFDEYGARYFSIPNAATTFTPTFPDHMPMAPLPTGFAVNTLLYALVPFAMFFAPGMLRLWRRRRRGLCLKCAYPIGESDVCTECGAAVLNLTRARDEPR